MSRPISARALAAIGAAAVVGLLAAPAAAAPLTGRISYRSDEFEGVSCLKGHGCVAVGSRYSSSSKTLKALAETRGPSGGSWAVHDPPGIGGATTVGFGPIGNGETVSCVAKPYTCVGIGSYNKGGHQFNYAAKWNGTSWKNVNPPDPKSTLSSGLDAISCTSAHSCLVVGHWLKLAGKHGQLESLQWNGNKWTLKSTLPIPAKSSGARLWGVSCVSKSFCNAVGDSLTSKLGLASLAETWNGKSWTIRATPSGTETIGSEFFDVKCQSRTSCLAVGTLAATWKGTAWHSVSFPVPAGSPIASAVALSCLSAKDCTAAGSYASGSSTLTAAWNWNGKSLTLQSTPSP